MIFFDKILRVPGAGSRLTIVIIVSIGIWAFVNYGLVPHPDHLDQFYPSIREKVVSYYESKNPA